MKRLLMFSVVLVLLMVTVSSVSADEADKASPILFRNGVASGLENVVSDPPPFPDAVPDDQVSLNGGSIIKIIVVPKRAAAVNNVVQQPSTYPDRAAKHAVVVPDDQFSLNGGSTISIIIPGKRAPNSENTDPVEGGGDSKPPRQKRAVAINDQYSLNGGSTISIIISSKRAALIEDPGDVGGGTTTTPKPNRAGLVAKRAGVVNDITIGPPPFPNSVPTDQVSLNSGSIIKIIVVPKRAVTIETTEESGGTGGNGKNG